MEGTINSNLNTDMKKTLLITLIASLSVTGTVLGQQAQRITLQEAINIALENNFQLKQAENELEIADQDIKSAYADFLPTLNGNIGGQRRTGRQFNDATGEFGDFTINGMNAGISSGITLFNGFSNINALRSTEQVKISREESLQRARENIIFNTATRYLQVLLSEQLLQISTKNLETSKEQLEQIKAQVEVGSLPIVNLYDQESVVAGNEFTVTQDENNVTLNELLLIRQLQIDPLGDYEFVIPDINQELISTVNSYEIRDLVNAALENRSDIKSEEATIKSLQYQLKITQALVLPRLTGSANLGSSYNDQTRELLRDINGNPIIDPITNSPIFQRVSFGDQFLDRNTSRTFGVSMSIPLFNNLNNRTSIQRSKINLKNAKLNLDNSKLQVIQEVTQAYNDYTSILKQFEASEKAMIASEKSFETQQERYNVGASTLIELSQAQSNYVTAQSNRSQALYNLIFQEKLLDYYLGRLSGSEIEF